METKKKLTHILINNFPVKNAESTRHEVHQAAKRINNIHDANPEDYDFSFRLCWKKKMLINKQRNMISSAVFPLVLVLIFDSSTTAIAPREQQMLEHFSPFPCICRKPRESFCL